MLYYQYIYTKSKGEKQLFLIVKILPPVGIDLTTNKIEDINIAINTKNKNYVSPLHLTRYFHRKTLALFIGLSVRLRGTPLFLFWKLGIFGFSTAIRP